MGLEVFLEPEGCFVNHQAEFFFFFFNKQAEEGGRFDLGLFGWVVPFSKILPKCFGYGWEDLALSLEPLLGSLRLVLA